MFSSKLQSLFLTRYISYEMLDASMSGYLRNVKQQHVTLYVDFNSIFNFLFNPRNIELFNEKENRAANNMTIIERLINFVAHYRHYLFSKYGKTSTVIFYYATDKSQYHLDIDPEYKKEFYEKRFDSQMFGSIRKMLTGQRNVLEALMLVLPHVYFVDLKNVDESSFPYMIMYNNDMSNNINMIVSNRVTTLLNLQYFPKLEVSFLSLRENDHAFYPRHKWGEFFMNETKSNGEYPKSFDTEYNYDFLLPILSVVFSLTGFRNHGITRIITPLSFMNTIKALKESGIVPQYELTVKEALTILHGSKVINDDNASVMKRNIKILSLANYYKEISNATLEMIMSQLNTSLDKDDAMVQFENYNKRYFMQKLNTRFIFEGE